MRYVLLDQATLDEKLAVLELESSAISKIRQEINYFDKYLVLQHEGSVGFIRIWRQHFSDQYMDLELEECDLMNFSGQAIAAELYVDVLDDLFEVPQVLRCKESDMQYFCSRGFCIIPDKNLKGSGSGYGSATLINMVLRVNKQLMHSEKNKNIRSMKLEDLGEIEKMFEQEYASRFRATRLLYDADPNLCFVYDKDMIEGVIFCEGKDDIIHVHQLLVRKAFQGKGIDKALLSYVLQCAIQKNVSAIEGSARGNLLHLYTRLGARPDPLKEQSHYLVRFEVQNQHR